VQKLGAAEGFGMQVGDLLQLEGSLAGDRQGRAAADRHEAVRGGERVERGSPIEPGRSDKPLRQAVERVG
jgi:hypothetical protein